MESSTNIPRKDYVTRDSVGAAKCSLLLLGDGGSDTFESQASRALLLLASVLSCLRGLISGKRHRAAHE